MFYNTKLAATFNTNRNYINDAIKLKAEKPIIFERVKKDLYLFKTKEHFYL